jgi:hypothetical protein
LSCNLAASLLLVLLQYLILLINKLLTKKIKRMKTLSKIRKILIDIWVFLTGRITQKQMRHIIMLSLQQSEFSRHERVVIKFPDDHPGIIFKAQVMHDLMKVSTWVSAVPDLTTKLSAYQTEINTYKEKEAKAQAGFPGAVAERDSFSATFKSETSEALRIIVQGVADANKTSALAVAQSCGMELQGLGGKSELEWSVRHGEKTGSVELAGSIKGYKTKRFAVQWQKTKDPSQESTYYLKENEIIPTLQLTTIVEGLTVKDTVYFRFRLVLKNGVTMWSETLSIVII